MCHRGTFATFFFSTKKKKWQNPQGHKTDTEETDWKFCLIFHFALQVTILSYTAIMATYLIMEYFKFTRSQV